MAKSTQNTKKAAANKTAPKKVKATIEKTALAGKGEGIQVAAGDPAAEPVKPSEIKDIVVDTFLSLITATANPIEEPKPENEQPETQQPEPDELDANEKESEEPENDEASEDDELHETMKPYLDAYPHVNKFHRSTDGQVFLDADKRYAEAHQQFIDEKKSLVEYVR